MKKGTSVRANALLWFGAAVSPAEIVTGTYYAPPASAGGSRPFCRVTGSAAFSCGLPGASAAVSGAVPWRASWGASASVGGMFFSLLNVVILSTVTTTFPDTWSAGISGESIVRRIPGKAIAVAVTVLGTAGAFLLPTDDITGFLYFISSVFAPMAAVLITERFFLHRAPIYGRIKCQSIVVWFISFLLYRLLMI